MIRLTGDIHGEYDRLAEYLPASRDDYVIILGDFGVLWDGSRAEEQALDDIEAMGLTVLFLDGNHENYDLLSKYPITQWHGGKVQRLRPHLIHLMRGQIYEIEGHTFFVMGGAECHDIEGGVIDLDDPKARSKIRIARLRMQNFRIKNLSWWAAELPTDEELAEGTQNLAAIGNQVDVVLTHCAPTSIQRKINAREYPVNRLTDYLETVNQNVDYSLWFFGHYHKDRVIDGKHILLFTGSVILNNALPKQSTNVEGSE